MTQLLEFVIITMFIAMLSLTGCTSVTSTQELGIYPDWLEKDEWNGVWIAAEKTILIV